MDMQLFAPKMSSPQKEGALVEERDEVKEEGAKSSTHNVSTATFEGLGLSEWVCKSVSAMGFLKPTPVQAECIPAILFGHDVIGCAETGSGKTAAFALPILQHLSQDPYGIFAIVLTPTRELAMQISEQFAAFGAAIGLRQTLIIGGENMTEQSLALKRLPHVVIATPGRLRHHLEGPDPPSLGRTPYLVMDEADRLLSRGFSSELDAILSAMSSPKRKTFLFSATMTESLAEVEKLAMKEALRFDLTEEQRVPAQLEQQYLFMPQQVKTAYLIGVVNKVLRKGVDGEDKDMEDDDGALSSKSNGGKKKGGRGQGKAAGSKKNPEDVLLGINDIDETSSHYSSIIIFAGTCRKCQEVHEIMSQMGIDTTVLHSMMTQQLRGSNLNKFKNQTSRILIATDVASRGLDIPEVDLVINLDLPRVAEDYVHRVGRTARAGKKGRALALITQYDVEILHGIEEYTGVKLVPSNEVTEEEVVTLLNAVSKATRLAQLNMLESGFDEKDQSRKEAKGGGKRKSKSKGGEPVRKRSSTLLAGEDGEGTSHSKTSAKKGKREGKREREGQRDRDKVKGGKGVPRNEEMSHVMRM